MSQLEVAEWSEAALQQAVKELDDAELAAHRLERVIARIERQARQQAILIDDLLDISRFRYGKLQLNREHLDLRIPLQHAIETFQGDFAAKQLKLKVQLSEDRISASADEARVAQILINLLSNASYIAISSALIH